MSFMIDLDFCDYVIIRQLCYDRREQVGLEECEKEGIGDLVRKVNAIMDGKKMIDYEKLILAHMLCEGFQYDCDFSVWHSKKEPRLFVIKFHDSDDMFHEYESENIDEIIEILRKFTQDKPKAKYELGQVMYFIDLPVNKIHQGYVKRVRDDEYIVVTDKPGPKEDYSESELYPSKQALIESQIEYWTSLRNEEISTKNEELREE